MPTWNPAKYLQFAEERSRPCHDLAARVKIATPRAIIDLGCGPGNSTEVLAGRWPDAEITGLDSSPDMIAAARERHPAANWIVGDIAAWAGGEPASFDLIFSNAALQWVRRQDEVLPQLFRRVRPGGALAVQVPSNWNAPAHAEMRALAESPVWADRLASARETDWRTESAGKYYDILAPLTEQIDLWETEYTHVMESASAIVEWYRGTGLRPFLEALTTEEERADFIEEYKDRLCLHYLPRSNGKVLFPFRRTFFIAYA